MSASLSRAPAATGKEPTAVTGREHVRTAQVIKPSRTRLNSRSASARWLVPHQATFPGSPGFGAVEARDAAEHGTLLLGDGRRLGYAQYGQPDRLLRQFALASWQPDHASMHARPTRKGKQEHGSAE